MWWMEGMHGQRQRGPSRLAAAHRCSTRRGRRAPALPRRTQTRHSRAPPSRSAPLLSWCCHTRRRRAALRPLRPAAAGTGLAVSGSRRPTQAAQQRSPATSIHARHRPPAAAGSCPGPDLPPSARARPRAAPSLPPRPATRARRQTVPAAGRPAGGAARWARLSAAVGAAAAGCDAGARHTSQQQLIGAASK